MAKQSKEQNPSRQREHPKQKRNVTSQEQSRDSGSGRRSGLGVDDAQRRQRDNVVTDRAGTDDASQGAAASPTPEPARGKRSSVESPIDPDAASAQGGAGTDTLTPGGRGGG